MHLIGCLDVGGISLSSFTFFLSLSLDCTFGFTFLFGVISAFNLCLGVAFNTRFRLCVNSDSWLNFTFVLWFSFTFDLKKLFFFWGKNFLSRISNLGFSVFPVLGFLFTWGIVLIIVSVFEFRGFIRGTVLLILFLLCELGPAPLIPGFRRMTMYLSSILVLYFVHFQFFSICTSSYVLSFTFLFFVFWPQFSLFLEYWKLWT